MAHNEVLADRVRRALNRRKVRFEEKKMFGGVCFLVDEKMLMGVEKQRLMARIDPDDEAKVLSRPGVKPMDFTGRIMKGYVFIDDQAVDKDTNLDFWLDLTLAFNPKARSSKKKVKQINLPMNSNQVDPNDLFSPMGDSALGGQALSSAVKKAAVRRAIKKAIVKRAVKKAVVRRAVKKRAVKKAVVRKAVKKRAVKKAVKKAVVRKAVKRRVAKKAVRKAVVKKAAKRRIVKKAVRKAAVKKAAKRRVAKKVVRKAAVKKAAKRRIVKKAVRKAAVKKAVRRAAPRKAARKAVRRRR